MRASPLCSGVLSGLLASTLATPPASAGELRGRVTSGGRPTAGVAVAAVPWECSAGPGASVGDIHFAEAALLSGRVVDARGALWRAPP